ncbi:Metal tolerance protein 9 [Phytophthora citrophthora]|uniref:Metal tolerance protein 9 n=1 Tax=Phytophthora citrophthora TaxID=4793 RepID=A0AAD9LUS7_9STRA|nr:Metal tolerance protein 9 [Phytophthora citrophthora]
MSQRVSSALRSPPDASPSELASPTASKPSTVMPWDFVLQVARGERSLDHVAVVLKASLFTNIVIVISMTSIAIASHSLALLSALVENMVDLFVQGLLWYAGTRSGKKQDYAKYPAGTSRFEPVAIIVAASVMVLASIVFIQESARKLIDGFTSGEPEAPSLSTAAIVIVVTAVVVKIGLMIYSAWILKSTFSAAVEAIHQDNLNDTISNSFAVAAYIVAAVKSEAWYVDPAGAILIFLYIMVSWGKMAWEQVTQLVGVCASEDFVLEVKELSRHHHPSMTLDIVRAYHFGSKYLVELEVVVPAEMSVKDAHDIALQLQFKVENLDEVERAFVHVDYQSRDYDEHVVSREEDALLMYAGYSSEQHKPTMENCGEMYASVPTEDNTLPTHIAVQIDVNNLPLNSPGRTAVLTPRAGSFEEFKD